MDKDNKTNNAEHSAKAVLDSLADMAARMGHPATTMEIIGIAAPEEADELQQKTSARNSITPLSVSPRRP